MGKLQKAVGKFTHQSSLINSQSFGFTLIELLIVIVMLGILLVGLVFIFNPVAQFNKAKNGQREHDLQQIKAALDTYYNDTKCYPTSLVFGTTWSVGSTVYLEKIPQDPDCSSNPSQCYVYQTDGTSCPQWNVVYGILQGNAIPTHACLLSEKSTGSSSCVPMNYASVGYNLCAVSGSIDCSAISATTIGPTIAPTSAGGGGGGGGSPRATPTPVLSCPNDQFYGCTGDNRCNSIFPKTQCAGYGGPVNCVCDQHCNQMCQFN